MRRNILFTTTILILAAAVSAWAAKCTKDLPDAVFAYFHEKPSKVDCKDYEYRLIDLNSDGKDEIFVTNYRKSCEEHGWCNFEVFRLNDKTWEHAATIPGRIQVLESKSNGYRDLATWNLGRRFVYVWDGQVYREGVQADIVRVPTELLPAPQK